MADLNFIQIGGIIIGGLFLLAMITRVITVIIIKTINENKKGGL